MRPLNFRSILRKSVLALALVAAIGGIAAAPASAEGFRHDDHGRYEHNDRRQAREWRAHDWREHRDLDGRRYAYGYGAPGYYAPPAFSFGLNFR